jgi:DNA repair exonuclease SbcCD ATPase subunit
MYINNYMSKQNNMQKQDYLTEDPIIPSLKYYCVSFFNKFNVKQSVENNNDYKEEVLNDKSKESYSTDENILGFKIRGGFSTLEDARSHAKRLSEIDPYHHIYVMEGGKWCAFVMKESDTNNYVEQTEYANDQLNDMMKKYNENQDKAKVYHEFRKNQMVAKNIDENIKNREDVLNETKLELDNCKNKKERLTLKEKLSTIDDQLNKMVERKKELQERENELSKTLGMGKLDSMIT